MSLPLSILSRNQPNKANDRSGRKAPSSRIKKRRPLRRSLDVEQLEPICLLATWSAIGPSPQPDYNVSGDLGKSWVTGRISALAIATSSTGAQSLLAGAASGGVWRSDNFTGATPTWSPKTDNIGIADPRIGLGSGAIAVGSIATVPGKPGVNNGHPTIYVGTGEANYRDHCQFGSGILKSTDGGQTWTLDSGPGLLPKKWSRWYESL